MSIFSTLLLVVVCLGCLRLLPRLFKRFPTRLKRQSKVSADWENVHQPQPNALGPALLNLVLTQMMQSQQDHHQRDLDQFWTAQEPGNDFASFSDNSWDM
jgi:hypothetical protein